MNRSFLPVAVLVVLVALAGVVAAVRPLRSEPVGPAGSVPADVARK